MSEVYTIDQLAAKFNITKRTIYYYSYIGLLPPAGRRGRSNTYTEEYVTKLENVLKYRGKMKLSAIPFVSNVEFTDKYNMSVLTLNLESSDTEFLQYAHDGMSKMIKQLSIQQSGLFVENAKESMIVAFPVNQSLFDKIKSHIDSLKNASRTFNGGVNFKTTISEDNFIPSASVEMSLQNG